MYVFKIFIKNVMPANQYKHNINPVSTSASALKHDHTPLTTTVYSDS